MYRYNPENIGEFIECDTGNNFTYKETKDVWALEHGLTHEIDLLNDIVAFAKIKRTVVYVCVDEDEDGSAVLEKWKIKKHIVFANQPTQ